MPFGGNNVKENRQKDRSNTSRVLLILLCIFLSIVLVFLIIVAIGQYYLDLINKDVDNSTMSSDEYQQWLDQQIQEEQPTGTAPEIDPEDVTWAEQNVEQGEHIINIMLIGQDRREGDGRQRSDSMILCTINTHTKTLTMTSFMRDLYVQIPGYNPNKMNACYQIGGMDLLDSCLETNFGVTVDGNVEVDFSGFMDIVDLMGGVDIELNQAEADYLNRRGNWDVNDATAGTWHLTAGVNHLTGEQALAYSRIRYVGNGDFERTERQRKVLTALLEQSRNLSLTKLNDLLQKALPMLTTDLSNREIVGYAAQVFAILPQLNVQTQRIPADGTWEYAIISNLDVVRMFDSDTNVDLLRKVMEEN